MNEAIKCIGVYKDCRYYYDGKNNQFFLLTPNFKITRYPSLYSAEVGEWCKKRKEVFLQTLKSEVIKPYDLFKEYENNNPNYTNITISSNLIDIIYYISANYNIINGKIIKK